MTYKRFEDLPVWNTAIDLAVRVFSLTEAERLRKFSDIRDHLERAAVSISNNIAEGFERGTKAELLTFLYIARGSAGEVRSLLCLMERMSSLDGLKSEISALKAQATSVSRQLGAWTESLKNSEITGTRYLDVRKRQEMESIRRRESFLEKLREVQSRNRPDPDEPSDREETSSLVWDLRFQI